MIARIWHSMKRSGCCSGLVRAGAPPLAGFRKALARFCWRIPSVAFRLSPNKSFEPESGQVANHGVCG
jgi:hypothetical protein